MQYQDGTRVAGYVDQDTVQLYDIKVKGQTFAAVEEQLAGSLGHAVRTTDPSSPLPLLTARCSQYWSGVFGLGFSQK